MSSPLSSIHLLDLPNEILFLILETLEYASEVAAVAQTCQSLCTIANTILYSSFGKLCSPYALKRIVLDGNEDALRKLLSAGISLDRYSLLKENRSLLPVAASQGRNNIIRLLLLHHGSAVIDGKLSDENEPLELAIDGGYLETVELLVQAGSTPGQKAQALLHASSAGNLEIVKFLVEKAGTPVQPRDPSRGNALLRAFRERKLSIVQFLLASGADPNRIWTTYLYLGRIGDYFPVLLSLLDAGLCLDMEPPYSYRLLGEIVSRLAKESENATGWTTLLERLQNLDTRLTKSTREDRGYLLCFAAAIGDKDLITTISDMGYTLPGIMCNPVQIAVDRGDCSVLRLLLEKLKSENDVQLHWQIESAITSAIHQDQKEALKTLLRHCFKDERVRMTRFPPHCTTNFSTGEMCPFLLNDSAVLENCTAWESILVEAIRVDNWKVTKLILDRTGVNPWYRWKSSDLLQYVNILTTAATYGALDCFKRMVNEDIQLDPTDADSREVLLAVIQGCQPDLIVHFLDSGFDVNFEHYGRALIFLLVDMVCSIDISEVLQLCIFNEAFRLLLDRGADINALDEDGSTALAYICPLEEDLTMLFLSRGADPLLGMEWNASALQKAIDCCRPDYVQMFLDAIASRGLHIPNFRSLIPTLGDEWEDGKILDAEENFGDKYFVVKAMERYYWRSIYPVPCEEGGLVEAMLS